MVHESKDSLTLAGALDTGSALFLEMKTMTWCWLARLFYQEWDPKTSVSQGNKVLSLFRSVYWQGYQGLVDGGDNIHPATWESVSMMLQLVRRKQKGKFKDPVKWFKWFIFKDIKYIGG